MCIRGIAANSLGQAASLKLHVHATTAPACPFLISTCATVFRGNVTRSDCATRHTRLVSCNEQSDVSQADTRCHSTQVRVKRNAGEIGHQRGGRTHG